MPRVCPRCGRPTAWAKRQDTYLSLFFVPLFPVKKGEEFLECEHCGPVAAGGWPQAGPAPRSAAAFSGPRLCTRCDRELKPEFTFCPYCGQRNP